MGNPPTVIENCDKNSILSIYAYLSQAVKSPINSSGNQTTAEHIKTFVSSVLNWVRLTKISILI